MANDLFREKSRSKQLKLKSVLVNSLRFSCTILIALLLLIGCVRSTESPIPVKIYNSNNGQTDELIIFLPGRGDDMGAFEHSGFIDTLHQSSRKAADSIVVDAHLGYYLDDSLPERIHQDVLLPFRQRGYKRFIIVGISLGGYGALWINHKYSNLISGMVLIAPYLGEKSLIEQIEAEGGVHSWRQQLDHDPGRDEKVWVWIDDMGGSDSMDNQSLILAIGLEDSYLGATELLADSYSSSQLFKHSGGHNWKTWRPLWSEITKSCSWEKLGYTR